MSIEIQHELLDKDKDIDCERCKNNIALYYIPKSMYWNGEEYFCEECFNIILFLVNSEG